MAGKNSVLILMGSKADLDAAEKAGAVLTALGISHHMHIASAHKTPKAVLSIVAEAEAQAKSGKVVLLAVVGMSNALSGMLAGSTSLPIITLPNSDNDHDIFSCLRMPSGISHMTVLGAENAALSAAKILAVGDSALSKKVADYQKKVADKVFAANKEIGN